MSDTYHENSKAKNGKKSENIKATSLAIFLTFLLCIITLVVYGFGSQKTIKWLWQLADALNEEYGYRYRGKSHKSMHEVIAHLPELDIPRLGLTPFALAMPDSCKTDNAIESYRDFYHKDKATFASWTRRGQPHWWDEEQAWTVKRITA